MPIEIERKFLVKNDDWHAQATEGVRLIQGYLSADPHLTVRVRIQGDAAVLTLKGGSRGISRLEFEYPIPLADAEEMLTALAVFPPIDKTRYLVRHEGHCWEIDVFTGANAGLVIAELELARPDEPFTRPDWLGEEVSGDPRYLNVNLARHPYGAW
ncbi:CYTH domain-containing protein [Caldichromatium japonicum]|uniref:CYTH domain-containing protein n=1 Tax=Caldichromatium japonicum TaxID=2699430 RepID=A0A6G7VAK9_9GAMM|nr:CYTH domain-containing protein [Caldichromatium japonicum]QIK37014.1 CYTH domain-containing protein [Caldichromatium japonicum]